MNIIISLYSMRESLSISRTCHKTEWRATHSAKGNKLRDNCHYFFVNGNKCNGIALRDDSCSPLGNAYQIQAVTPFNLIEYEDSLNKINEIDCTYGNRPLESEVYVPYDHLQEAAYEGSCALEVVLTQIKPTLKEKCELLYNKHKSFALDRGSTDMQSCNSNALRSIKCLLYWVTGKILTLVKVSRDRYDIQTGIPIEEANTEREKCNELVKHFVSDILSNWEGSTSSKAIKSETTKYPVYEDCKSPEEYARKTWSYFNAKIFKDALPDFWELEFKWYDIFSDKPRSKYVSGELFDYSDVNLLGFPSILYPKELGTYKSAFGNIIFRSMVKFFCDLYSNKLENLDHCKVVIDAFKFVESEQASNDGINFTVIQKPFEVLVNYDPSTIAAYNAINSHINYDMNDKRALVLDVTHVPYIKNPIDFDNICKVLVDTDKKSILELYNESFDILMLKQPENIQRYRNIWKEEQKGNITIPLMELKRALIFGDLDEFGNIISYGMNDLLKLKPVQLNFVQNSIVTLCVDFLNNLRSLAAYESNYMFIDTNSPVSKSLERMNNSIVNCVACILKVYEKCVANNGLFPLGNTFLGTSPLESLIPFDVYTAENVSTIEDYVSTYAKEISTMKGDNQEIKFPEEYINDAVSPDNVLALKFLVNYYNFNLFGGRLPIDISIKFKCESNSYLSSNDASPSILRIPTIYLHPLIKENKVLISRLILDECFKIFLYWTNKFKFDEIGTQTTLEDILEGNLEERLLVHIYNRIERSNSWPFHFDNLQLEMNHKISTPESNRFMDSESDNLNKIFRELFHKDVDITKELTKLVERDDPSNLWEKNIVPMRHFITALECGDYDLSYALIANPSSISNVSRLSISDINRLENLFKDVSKSYLRKSYLSWDYATHKKKIITYFENLKIIECACDELREEAVKHALISAPDLIMGVSDVTSQLAYSLSHKEDIDATVNCSVKELENIYLEYEKQNKKYSEENGNNLTGSEPFHVLSEDERATLAQLLYKSYNEHLFGNSLPKTPKIEFVDYIDDLSLLKIDYFSVDGFKILINDVINEIKFLCLHILIQMIHINYFSTRHCVEVDSLKTLNFPFKSAFNAAHQNKTKFLKGKLLPIAREKRLKAKNSKGDHNEEFIKLVQESVNYKIKSKEDIFLMEVDEFVDEILVGREKIHKKNKLCNPLEEYHTLKVFATHFMSSKYVTYDTSVENYDESVLKTFHPTAMKDVWIRNKFEIIRNILSKKGINIPNDESSDHMWYNHLDKKQQELFVEYVTNKSVGGEGLFLILTKSGACDKKGAFEILKKIFISEASEEIVREHANPTSTGLYPEKDNNTNDLVDNTDVLGENEFSKEISCILGSADPKIAECATILSEKLVKEDFIEARNIINASQSPSYLIEVVTKLIETIKKYNMIDKRTYDNMLTFLS
ncbi:hypothetical protein BEWA_017600 [Theileria equi strain WA]|uniref:Uncharacterized protein n=1 Tax=Theileria equi strain WA TaxID=1537102 RepID=L0AVL6_THEEQ|nr:hypothetical protein BEWA_017600 [Theileria equi strain WA]AFZ78919.1 hypothetical protein BEWA_017600 [Theileria equi strain WA]|eukprot:XP_004828585.1 hypothetical protein BEWA_017600 [Theileria equi strain WA]